MTDLVLVHGAWHGAWCWQRVLPAIWAAGHRAFTVTLSGVGERSHLPSLGISLDTHIADVMAVIEAEELRRAVLVGHSYAGMVITGVADRLAGRPEQRLARLVYLDAVVPLPGESWSSSHSAETRTQRRDAIARLGSLPPPDPAIFGLADEDRAWVARRQTPHPGATYDAVLDFDAARVATVARSFIDCTAPALATIDLSRQRVRSDHGWQVIEIAVGHDPMVSAPDALTRILLDLARMCRRADE